MRDLLEKGPNRPSSLLDRQSDRPAASVTCAFSLGITLSLICHNYSFIGLVAADICTIYAAFLAIRVDRRVLPLPLGLAAISISGLLMALACRDGISAADLRNHIAERSFQLGEPVSSEGCVVRESEMRGEESVATVELLAFRRKDQWITCKGLGILRVAGSASEQPPEREFKLMRGDRIRGWATWSLPRNFENPGSNDSAGLLMRRGIFVVGKIKSFRLLEIIPGGCINPWTRLANSVGARVRRTLEPLQSIERGQPKAVLASLIIGDYSGLDNGTRQAFQNSGTFHVLVVSGLHVAWITGLLLQFFKLIRLPERIRYVLAFFVILFYTCVVGYQASITRCLWMFLLYLIGRVIFRQADTVNIVLGSALILLLAQPSWLFEAGFQLSFVSVLAIALTASPAVNNYLKPVCQPMLFSGNPDRLFLQSGKCHSLGRHLRLRCEIPIEEIADSISPALSRVLLFICRGIAGAGLAVGSLVVTSLAVQIWLQPLLACYFNRISWISAVANLLIVPFSSVVLATGTLAACAANLPWFGPGLMRLAGTLASFLLSCASRITDIPGAWQRCPTPSPAWVLAGILLLFTWSFFQWHRSWIPWAGIAALLACLSCGSVPGLGPVLQEARFAARDRKAIPWGRKESILSLTFLDVGEGDSTVIRFPDMRVWILDAGGLRQAQSAEDSAYVFDIGEAVVSRYLWHFWIRRIDRVVLSHPDIDHAGGAAAVMKNFPFNRFDYARAGPDELIKALLNIAREKNADSQQLHAGMEERIGPVAVRALNPPADRLFSSTNENSLVLQLCFNRFSALLTGDLERSGEMELLARTDLLGCQLLKVAHHGSRSGTTDAFLDRVQPRWAAISVGRNNPFGHPSSETMHRLQQHGTRPISTVEEGAVTFETDGYSYVLKSHIHGILEWGVL
jgi:competence protein ComEC